MESRFRETRPFPDVIFLDLNMPIWDGWEFYKAFHKLPASELVKTYILTSSVSEYDIRTAESNWHLSNNYITKTDRIPAS
jgi:CheY-like chemotaxis protein